MSLFPRLLFSEEILTVFAVKNGVSKDLHFFNLLAALNHFNWNDLGEISRQYLLKTLLESNS